MVRQSTTDDSVILNFFLELDTRAIKMAQDINLNITYSLSQNEVHFYDRHVPHLTLYQSAFPADLSSVLKLCVRSLLTSFSRTRKTNRKNRFTSIKNLLDQCTVVLRGGTQFSDFITWDAEENPCLEELNRSLVIAFEKHRVKNQPIPQWVINEPNSTLREMLTDSFSDYGYPFIAPYGTFQTGLVNSFLYILVYGEFTFGGGRVTVGFDDTESLRYAFSQLNFPSVTFVPVNIGMAIASPHDMIEEVDIIALQQLKKTYP